MNIVEAIRSGKPFRRKSWEAPIYGVRADFWFNEIEDGYLKDLDYDEHNSIVVFDSDSPHSDRELVSDDILADDWEIKD